MASSEVSGSSHESSTIRILLLGTVIQNWKTNGFCDVLVYPRIVHLQFYASVFRSGYLVLKNVISLSRLNNFALEMMLGNIDIDQIPLGIRECCFISPQNIIPPWTLCQESLLFKFWSYWGGNSVCVCLVASVMSNSVRPYELYLTRLLCPWDSPGKNSGVGCHALLQGIILTQRSNQCLLHCRWILYHWATGEALLVLPLSRNKLYPCSESPWTNNINRLNVFSPFIHKSVIKKG